MTSLIIYTKSNCKQCDKVKLILNAKNIKYVEKDVTYDVHLVREMIERSGGRKTTPQIFLNGKLVNSLEEIAA